MFCGSAFKNKGVQPLLDAVVDYLPSPIDVPAIKASTSRRKKRPPASFRRRAAVDAGLQDHERPVRRFADLCRIYSGKLERAPRLMNTVKEKRERVGRMLQMHSNSAVKTSRKPLRATSSRFAGLKETTTGDTLCDPLKPVILERMEFPEPVISDRHRAEDQGRPGKDGPRAQPPGCRRSFVPRQDRRRIRPDDHRGHGRIAPRHPRRPHASRVQGRGQCRRAAGCLP
jgi:elongation factor G